MHRNTAYRISREVWVDFRIYTKLRGFVQVPRRIGACGSRISHNFGELHQILFLVPRDIGNHPQQVAAHIPVYHHSEFKFSVYCHLKFKISVYTTNLHVEFDRKDPACGMSAAASWLRCSVCHRTGPNRGAIRSHQRQCVPRTAALLARANKCAGGAVERVTTVPAHGLLCARQVVTEDAPSRDAAAPVPAAPRHDDPR